jgi:tetratricopeptide (TPR) repeat protein
MDKSLVAVDRGPGSEARYRYLETIRQYAREKLLDSGEAPVVRTRHRDWFLVLAEQGEPHLRGPARTQWLDRLAVEHDNLRAALEWCRAQPGQAQAGLRLAGALWRFWLLRDHWSEGFAWLEAMLALPGADAPTTARAKALYAAGSLVVHPTRARTLLEESVALWRTLGDRKGLGYALDSLGDEFRMVGELATARAMAEESVALARASGDREAEAGFLYQLGRVVMEMGEDATARTLLEQSQVLHRAGGDKIGGAGCLYQLGRLALKAGDYLQARARFMESLQLHRESGTTDGTGWVLNSLGEVARFLGDYGPAAGYYEESLHRFRTLGNKRGVATLLHNLGYVAQAQGDLRRAATLFGEALALGQEMSSRRMIAECLTGLGGVVARRGQAAPAARIFGAAAALFAAVGTSLAPADEHEYTHSRDLACAALDPAAWAAAWAAGQALPLEQAIAEALELADDPYAGPPPPPREGDS